MKGPGGAVEMTEPWKAWKTKTRFPTFPRAARDYNDGFCLAKDQDQNIK